MSKEEWQVGWYLDYQDLAARQWSVIKILEINRQKDELAFEFDGWPKKWNSVCKISSKKLVPFRLKSQLYTGPKENAIREWSFRLEEIQACEEKLKAYIIGSLSSGNALETTQFLRGEVFTLVDNLLVTNYRKNEHVRVANFLTTVTQYIVEWMKRASEFFPLYYEWLNNPETMLTDDKVALAVSWPELLLTLKRIFGLDPRTSKFHRNYSISLKDYEPWYGSQIRNSFQITSFFVNIFGKKEGFDIIISLLSQKEEKNKIPFEFLKEIPVFEVSQLFDKKLNDSFTLGLKDLILQRIESVSNKELKELNKDHVSEVIYKCKKMISECFKRLNLEEFDKADLSIILKFFRSPYMEKRLRALNEINDLIERVSKTSAYRETSWPSSKQLAEWIIKEQILQQTLSYSHAEMMKRVSDIAIFLCKNDQLSKTLLDLFWESAIGKHDSIIIETHKALMDLSDFLKIDMLSHLYKKIKEVSLTQYDEKFLKLAKDLSIKLFNMMYNSKTNPEEIGTEIFFPLLKDSCPVNFCELAVEYLGDLIKHPVFRNKVDKFLQVCIENVLANSSVLPYLRLFQVIISQVQFSSIEEVLKVIDRNFKVLDTILNNFQNYMLNAPDDPSIIIEGRYSHKQNIEVRLKVISSLTTSNTLSFEFKHFNILWTIFVGSRNLQDSETFFLWVQELSREKLSKTLISEIFTNLLCKLPVAEMTLNAYECFKTQFLLVNFNERLIEMRAGGFYNRLNEALLGLESLYEIAVNTQIEQIQENCSMFIVALNLRLIKSALSSKFTIWNNFISSLFTFYKPEAPEVITRILKILQNFLEENYVIGNSTSTETKTYHYKHVNDQAYGKITVNTSETIRSVRKRFEEIYKRPWKTICLRVNTTLYDSSNDSLQVYSLPIIKVLMIEFISPKDEETGPREFLSTNEKVQTTLFDLLTDHHQPYAHEAWTLLTTLPTNKAIKESLTELKTDLERIIDDHSLYKILYCLLIVKELVQDEDWVLRFKEKRGFEYIIELFQEHDVFSFNDSTCMKYSTVMIVLIEECFKFTLTITPKFVQQLCDCLIMIAKYSQDGEDEKIVAVGQSAKNIFSEICTVKASLLTEALSEYERLSELLEMSFLRCRNFQYSNIMSNLFLQILDACGQLLPFITRKLFLLVDTAVLSKHSGCYWTLLSQCVSEERDSESIKKDLKLLKKYFEKHTGEFSSKDKSVELAGIMAVLRAAIERKHLEPRSKFLKMVLEKFLFNTSIELNLPKCKSEENRRLAFEIVEKSIACKPKCVNTVVKFLSQFHNNTQWRTRNIHDWNYSPASEEKSTTGFVGLKNFGNICYMNSTLQQLFNIPSFCEEVLRAPMPADKKEESVTHSLQFIFSGLKNSAKQYMNPRKLCSTFKDWEGRPLNINEQMDADEFFNNLMDKLETESKGTQFEHSIRNHFGGIQITECIGKGPCVHKSERAEAFMTLPVQVKNKKSLLESLESFVEGEILEGDNAYQCDYCETKVTALRRVCIKHIPNILIIALRRFEFDFDTMNRVKVNDYCEFPMDIDMEPYTQEGLERKETAKDAKERKFPEDYYKFKLKGITIHTGTAESGHYYAYIQNRDSSKWYEFNDIFVNGFDPDDIPTEAFGGVERWNNFYSSSYMSNVREKYRNAYLLFYEREHKYAYRKDEESLEDLQICLNNTQSVLFQEVVDENDRYWRCKSIFSLEYFGFVSKLLRSEKENEAIVKFCTAAFLVIFIRSKDLVNSGEFLTNLEVALQKLETVRNWICELICVRAVYKELIVDCPIEDKSRFIVEIVALAFEGLGKDDFPRVFNNFLYLFPQAAYSRNNGTYFKLLLVLVQKNTKHCRKTELLSWLLKFLNNQEIAEERSPTFKGKDIYLGHEQNVLPVFDRVSEERYPSCLPSVLLLMASEVSEEQGRVFFGKSVMKNLVNVNHKVGSKAVAGLYVKICGGSKERFREYLNCLLNYYKENDFDKSKIYFRQLKVLFDTDDCDQVFSSFLSSAQEFKSYIKITEFTIDFIFKLCSRNPKIKDSYLSKPRETKWIENWLKDYSYSSRIGYSTYKKSTMVMMSSSTAGKTHNERIEFLKKLSKNLSVESSDWDSDEEFPLQSIQDNNSIDVYETSMSRWVKGYVVYKVREILAVKLDSFSDKTLKWYSLDSEFIAPDGTKVKISRN